MSIKEEIEGKEADGKRFISDLLRVIEEHSFSLGTLDDSRGFKKQLLEDLQAHFLEKLKRTEEEEEKQLYIRHLEEVQEAILDIEDRVNGVSEADRERAAERMRQKVQSSFEKGE